MHAQAHACAERSNCSTVFWQLLLCSGLGPPFLPRQEAPMRSCGVTGPCMPAERGLHTHRNTPVHFKLLAVHAS